MFKHASLVAALVALATFVVTPAVAQTSASRMSSHKMHKMKMTSQEVMKHHRGMGKTDSKGHGAMGHGAMSHGAMSHGAMGHGEKGHGEKEHDRKAKKKGQ